MSTTDLGSMFNLSRITPAPPPENAESPRDEPGEQQPAARADESSPGTRPAEPGTDASGGTGEPQPAAQPTPTAVATTPAERPTQRRRTRPATAADPAKNPPASTPPPRAAADTPVRPGEKRSSTPRAAPRPQIMVALPVDTGTSFKQRAAASRMSYAQLMLVAVEETYEDDLPAEFAKRTGGRRGLFSTSSYAPRTDNGPRVKLNLHLLASDLDTIDDLWNSCEGCHNRNDYLSTAVELFLAKTSQT